MRQVEFIPFKLTDIADIFSIRIDGKDNSELHEFFISFRNTPDIDLQKDFEQIVKSLVEMGNQGAKEHFFRPEGKMKDRVCAIPLYPSSHRSKKQNGTLRLYCIRISDKLLIVGGGGLKTTQTYEEDDVLSKHVQTLQSIDQELSNIEKEGKDLHKEIYNLTIQIN